MKTQALIKSFALALALNATALSAPPPSGFNPRPILDAIRFVETGSRKDANTAVGDSGRALGAYQIHLSYWQDAVERDPSLTANGETYQSVTNPKYAEKVILAYWTRYATNWTHDELSRIHNGGPVGHKRSATKAYWHKVKARLNA
jgi:hypothetical protein